MTQPDAASNESRADHSRENAAGTPYDAPRVITRPMNHEARSSLRWWLAVIAAIVLAAPLAWILSYAAALPFLLGSFFFALLGLVIGAAAFRIARPGMPYARFPILVGTTLIVGAGWSITVIKEARDFPGDMAKLATARTFNLGGRSVAEFQYAVSENVSTYLRDRFPPGGVLGYIRWVLASGEIRKGDLPLVSQSIHAPQKGLFWALRVTMCAALFAFGVGSQTLIMARPAKPNETQKS